MILMVFVAKIPGLLDLLDIHGTFLSRYVLGSEG